MNRALQPENGRTDELEELGTMLQESYAASYRGSSLKVRRRYRKMLLALEAEAKRRDHAPALAEKAHLTTGLHR